MMWPMSDNPIPFRFRRKWLAAAILALLVVLTLTHVPQAVMPRFLQETLLDKVEHVLAYGVISSLFLLSLPNRVSLTIPAVGLLTLAGIGVLDEVTQPLVNRCASVGDFAADLIGILIPFAIFLVKRRFRSDIDLQRTDLRDP